MPLPSKRVLKPAAYPWPYGKAGGAEVPSNDIIHAMHISALHLLSCCAAQWTDTLRIGQTAMLVLILGSVKTSLIR